MVRIVVRIVVEIGCALAWCRGLQEGARFTMLPGRGCDLPWRPDRGARAVMETSFVRGNSQLCLQPIPRTCEA